MDRNGVIHSHEAHDTTAKDMKAEFDARPPSVTSIGLGNKIYFIPNLISIEFQD